VSIGSAQRDTATPRLGRIQWVGPAVAGLLTLAAAVSQPPLFDRWDHDDLAVASSPYSVVLPLWTSLIYTPLLGVLLAAFVGAFRAIAASPRRSEFAALISLGAPRRELVRHQVKLGWRHGVNAAWGGTACGLGFTQAREGLGGEFMSATLWMVLTSACVATVATVAAYAVVARWIVPPVATAREHQAPATGPVAVPRRRLRVGWIVVWCVIAASVAGAALTAGSASSSGVTTVIAMSSALVLMVAIPSVIVWAGSLAANRLSTLAGRALLRGGVAARIAGDGLTRPTPARAVAIGAVGLVLGTTAYIGLMINPMAARNTAGGALTPEVILSTAALESDNEEERVAPTPPGWESTAIDPSLLADLAADERLIVVPGAMLTATVAWPGETDAGDDAGNDASAEVYMALLPSDLGRVSPASTTALYFDGPTALGGGPSQATIAVGDVNATVDSPRVAAPFTAVPRDWAESVFGPAPTSVALIYGVPGGPSVSEALRDYDLTGLHVRESGRGADVDGGLDPASTLIVSGTLLLIAVGLVIALSLSAAKSRGHDYATLTALGAPREALRWGTAIESAVMTSTGAFVGIAVGSGLGLASSLSGDHAPSRLLGSAIRFDLSQAPWGVLATLAIGAVVLGAGASVAARMRVETLSPAEQLREAVREGAS